VKPPGIVTWLKFLLKTSTVAALKFEAYRKLADPTEPSVERDRFLPCAEGAKLP
jgi:hypothetical protein